MNSILKTIICIATVIAFSSCEDKVQIDIDQKGKTLTVDAFLNNLRQNQTVRLTYTDSYFSGQTPPALIGAFVTVQDVTANKNYTFVDNNDGNYTYNLVATDTIIYTDHVYQLNIKYNSYEYNALTSCKRSTKIDSVFFKYEETVNGIGNNSITGNILHLNASDATGPIPDFYWVKVYKNGEFYGRPENIQLPSFGNNNEYDGFFFIDNVWQTSGPDGSVDPCNNGDVARLEICGISKEAYDFLNLGQMMSNNSGLFATTPVNLPTNISPLDKSYPKAVGLFNVGDITYRELVCP
jgi:Domain of unknown function (DUF4249)